MEKFEDIKQKKEKAYEEVKKACAWILSLAKNKHYYDDYTKRIDSSGCTYSMPIAEILMCLTNCLEGKYKPYGLPLAEKSLLTSVTTDLIAAKEEHGFSGRPYLVPAEGSIKDPPFTDAVAYIAGALISVLRVNLMDKDVIEKCENLLIECIDWLLKAKKVFPKDGPLKGAGWAWSSPLDINGNAEWKKFINQLPVQTYFTSNVMTTLCEALFDCPELLESKNLTRNVLESIVEAKKFLLSAWFTKRTDDKGWADYRYYSDKDKEYKASYNTEMKPYGLAGPQTGYWKFSVYGLEPLTYIKYYCDEYGKVTKDLKEKHNDLFNEFKNFAPSDVANLEGIFCDLPKKVTPKNIHKEICKIQVPEPFNLNAMGESYYIDGTVGYNMLNTVNFYLKYFPQEDSDVKDAWQESEDMLTNTLIDQTFKENGFTHCSGDENTKDEAIYASRTAIATLLSWGVQPPMKISKEIKDQIEKLYYMVSGIPVEEKTTQASGVIDRNAYAKDDIKKILSMGYLVGIATALLLKAIKAPDQKVPWINDLFEPMKKREPENIVNANGKFMIDVFTAIVDGSVKDTHGEIDAILQLQGLSKAYKTFVQEIGKDVEIISNFENRMKTVNKLEDAVKAMFKSTAEENNVEELLHVCR